ncbi:MAG: hypothetical protein WCF98_05995 [Synechococcus sp. ELA057]
MASPSGIRMLPLGVASGIAAALLLQSPAQAGLWRPLLLLLRPQLESRLAEVCVRTAAGDNPDLAARLQDPCHKLAVPTSKCLIEETDSSGRSVGVLSELMRGRFGDDSELVVKRCLARLFGIPPDSLKDVPLQELARRFGSISQPAEARTEPVPDQAGPPRR